MAKVPHLDLQSLYCSFTLLFAFDDGLSRTFDLAESAGGQIVDPQSERLRPIDSFDATSHFVAFEV